jgi:hypothetical protein
VTASEFLPSDNLLPHSQPKPYSMRRPSKETSLKLSAESQRLISFAQALTQAASRVEERNWERALDSLIHKMLKGSHQEQIDAALNHLFLQDLSAYDALMDAVEASSESMQLDLEHDGVKQKYDALLIATPILAWTRFSIASGPFAADIAQALLTEFQALLAPDCKVALMPTLYSIDQLPRNHGDTHTLLQKMAQAASKGSALRAPAKVAETAPFLADTRYLLFVLLTKQGEPLFRWQMAGRNTDFVAERNSALEQWKARALGPVTRLLPGCGIELLLPEAYFVACREADKQVRPITIRAAVHYLTQAFSMGPNELRAIVAPFAEDPVNGPTEEYRISFTLKDSIDVIYGIVWPLYGPEDEDQGQEPATLPGLAAAVGKPDEDKKPIAEILELLQQDGIETVLRHNERFPAEYCEDCGAPLFADPDGELTHAEMPEDTPPGTAHFH